MGVAAGAGYGVHVGYSNTAAVLVLFILLVIITSVYGFGW